MLREEEQLSAFVIASLQSRNHIVQESTVLKYSVLNVVVCVSIASLSFSGGSSHFRRNCYNKICMHYRWRRIVKRCFPSGNIELRRDARGTPSALSSSESYV